MPGAPTTTAPEITFAPGARVLIRDAEWVVRSVDPSAAGGQQLLCVGSVLVRQPGLFTMSATTAKGQIDVGRFRVLASGRTQPSRALSPVRVFVPTFCAPHRVARNA